MKKHWGKRACALVVGCILTTGLALGAAGDASDPLVTLSYLTQTVTPSIMTQVDKLIADKAAETEKKFEKAIAAAGSGGGSAQSAAFTLVSLNAGQKLLPEVGCEMLLRIGTAKVTADSTPALINMTTGEAVKSGASLKTNHLYLCTIADRVIEASTSMKILVRGGYSIT